MADSCTLADEESDWEDETLVMVEISGVIDTDFLAMEETENHSRVLGIDTSKPLVQLGSHIFSGEYENCVGTCIIFEDLQNADSKPRLKYVCHSDRKLLLNRVFLQDKHKTPPGLLPVAHTDSPDKQVKTNKGSCHDNLTAVNNVEATSPEITSHAQMDVEKVSENLKVN